MILYLDASALVKRYVAEIGSSEVKLLIEGADTVGTATITRVEVVAAIAKSVRMKVLSLDAARGALLVFRKQWPDFVRVQFGETLIANADALAWEHNLRGYDAVHLAAARFWQEAIGEPITLATYDQQLWQAGQRVGMHVWPKDFA
jgi:predicted nucleic acid-binding protein